MKQYELKQQIKRDLAAHVDGAGFINKTQVGTFMKAGDDSVNGILAGLEYFQDGRSKRYLISDVAGRIASKMAG